MPLVHDRCICLRKIEYSETSQILLLLAREHGLQRLIAKGAHRKTKAGASKFGGGVDLLEVGDAVFTHRPERELATLTEWDLREGHPALRRNLRSLYLGLYAAEMVSLLLEEHDPHPEAFDRLEQTLGELGTPRVEEVFVAFELDMLRESGILPEISLCVGCGQPVDGRETCYFSPSRGGIVCKSCQGTIHDCIELDAGLLRVVQTIMRTPRVGSSPQRLPRLTRRQSDPLNRIFALHMQHTLGRQLSVAAYVIGSGRWAVGSGQ
jgi:DNA repair protein RecO (recombination protein O)